METFINLMRESVSLSTPSATTPSNTNSPNFNFTGSNNTPPTQSTFNGFPN